MSQFDELLETRRSIRAYSDKLPDDETISKILQSTLNAPSPSNLQPVRFIRIKTIAIREKLRLEMNEGNRKFLELIQQNSMKQNVKNWVNSYFRYSDFMFKAPIIMAIGTVENEKSFSKVLHHNGLIEHDTRGDTDMDISVGIAINTFILKAVEQDLATCVLSAPLTYINDIEKTLGLDGITIKCFVTLGYPSETPNERIHKTVSEIYREL